MMWLGLVVFMRVGAAMALLPAFGEQSVPQRFRLVLALAFTAIVAPAVDGVPDRSLQIALPLLSEVAVGLMLGGGLRMFVMALQISGAMIAQATSLSQLFGGTGPEPQPAIGNLLVMAGLAIAVAGGLHVRLAEMFILSYQFLPAGGTLIVSDAAKWGLTQVSQAFGLAFSLAAPFTIAALLYNIAIGVMNRAMPALMVSMIGAPALTAGGLILMAIIAPIALAIWWQHLQGFIENPFRPAP